MNVIKAALWHRETFLPDRGCHSVHCSVLWRSYFSWATEALIRARLETSRRRRQHWCFYTQRQVTYARATTMGGNDMNTHSGLLLSPLLLSRVISLCSSYFRWSHPTVSETLQLGVGQFSFVKINPGCWVEGEKKLFSIKMKHEISSCGVTAVPLVAAYCAVR